MPEEFRIRLRIIGTDIDGALKVPYALRKIKGVNLSLANAILNKAHINQDVKAGFLTESQIEKIEEIVRDHVKFGLQSWLLNKRKDLATGDDMHLIGADLDLRNKMDIDQMKEIKSWRGYRHAYGLKVRGQRTKTTGRKGKSLGVKRKSLRRER